jgi:hypothetical protein
MSTGNQKGFMNIATKGHIESESYVKLDLSVNTLISNEAYSGIGCIVPISHSH